MQSFYEFVDAAIILFSRFNVKSMHLRYYCKLFALFVKSQQMQAKIERECYFAAVLEMAFRPLTCSRAERMSCPPMQSTQSMRALLISCRLIVVTRA